MARNLTEQLVHDLGLAIIQGTYGEDGGLPSEAVICEDFGVSRTSTREAVKMLSSKGMLGSRPRQGIRILPETRWNLFDPELLGWLLQSRPSHDLLLEFAQMRVGIEPESAALAAQYAKPEDIAQIEAAWQRMFDAKTGLEDGLKADIDFHVAILCASGNRFYKQMSAFIETALRISIRYTNQAKGVHSADVDAHEVLLQAIKDKKPELARQQNLLLLDEVVELIQNNPI